MASPQSDSFLDKSERRGPTWAKRKERHGRGPGRRSIKGTLEMIVLEVLQHVPMHGWGITQLIERRSQGLLSVNHGSLYPALYRLVGRGWVSSEWRTTDNNRQARYCTLTRAGRKQLAAERAQWEKLSRGVDFILGGAPA
ncbi:MAG TPA: PadR family transcriptional regulator [Gemmatimonadaceae bacterium]